MDIDFFFPPPKRKQASTFPPLFSWLPGKQQRVIWMLFHDIHLFSLPRGVVVSGLPVLWVHGYGPERRAPESRPISTVVVIFAEVGRSEVEPGAAAGGTRCLPRLWGLAFSCFLILHSPLICPTMLHFHWFPLTLASPFCGSACLVIKSVFLDEFSCFITYQISITYALQSAFLSRHSY